MRPSDLLRVKTTIIRRLPVLIFQKADPKSSRAKGPTLDAAEPRDVSDSSLITSVYCDNYQHDVSWTSERIELQLVFVFFFILSRLQSYTSRLDRKEGATLFRIRGYDGDKVSDAMRQR